MLARSFAGLFAAWLVGLLAWRACVLTLACSLACLLACWHAGCLAYVLARLRACSIGYLLAGMVACSLARLGCWLVGLLTCYELNHDDAVGPRGRSCRAVGIGWGGAGRWMPSTLPSSRCKQARKKTNMCVQIQNEKKTMLTKSYRGLFPRAVYIGSRQRIQNRHTHILIHIYIYNMR